MADNDKNTTQGILSAKDSLLQFNQRKLKIALKKNFISKSLYHEMNRQLTQQFTRGEEASCEEILSSYKKGLTNEIQPVITKELFKYNQIIVKLAQQLSKNKTVQNLKIRGKSHQEIQATLRGMQKKFSLVLKQLTDDFLSGVQYNIDDVLLEARLVTPSEIDFLHKGAEHLEIKAMDKKFGRIVVDHSYASQEVVNEALDEQTRLYRETNKNHIIGDIMVDRQHITTDIRNDILLMQNRVMEEDWEDVLKNAGKTSIEEKEKSALFGALAVKEKMLDKEQVVKALKIQARELETGKEEERQSPQKKAAKPRWIGDILVETCGLSDQDRSKIVKKQMSYRIEHINLKFGLNITNAQQELFRELEKYFHLSYSRERIQAYVKVIREIPDTMTRDNISLWLYRKNITYGRINAAITSLLANEVKPGQKILLARGEDPEPDDVIYRFHVKPNGDNQNKVLPLIVPRGKELVTGKRKKGKSGLNVNNCFVYPRVQNSNPLVKGKNVRKSGEKFFAECDGIPLLSEKNVLSVSSAIQIKGDIDRSASPVHFDCDFHVTGAVNREVQMNCRKLEAGSFMGELVCSGEVSIADKTSDASMDSRGPIKLSRVSNSTITGKTNIVIENRIKKNSGSPDQGIENSIITCDDICTIKSNIASSVVRAKNRIIVKKGNIGPDCKFVVGDSLEVIACKKKIEALTSRITSITEKIEALQKKSHAVFQKIEKKDVEQLEKEIKAVSRNQKTLADVERLNELRRIKREKERHYKNSVDDSGKKLIDISRMIKLQKKTKQECEKAVNDMKTKIVSLYKKEAEPPEMDFRKVIVPEGTIVQFPHNQKKLDADSTGFLFREVYSHESQRFEIKQHRW